MGTESRSHPPRDGPAQRALLACAAVLLAGPTVLAFFSGGFFDQARLWAGVIAMATLAVVAVLADPPLPRTRVARLSLLGLALLAAVTCVSVLWAPISAGAIDDGQRILLYMAATTAAVALLRTRRAARAVEPAVALGGFLVVGYGLSERLLPGLVELSTSPSAAGRLEQPVTYWNAVGAIAAMALTACARMAGDPDRHDRVRVGSAAAVAPLAVGLYLTFSRGSIGVAFVGLLLLLLLSPTTAQARALAVTLVAGGLGAVASMPLADVHGVAGDRSSRGLQGAALLLVLVLLAAGAATALRAMLRAEHSGRLQVRRLALSHRWFALTGLVALPAIVVALLVVSSADRRPVAAARAQRLGNVESNRYAYWKVAVRSFADEPLLGVGASGFRLEWLRERDKNEAVRDAHSLYLETAAELGLLGLAALALFIGGVGACALAVHRREPALAAGPVAVVSVWAVAAAVDWHWEMPAVTLPALIAAAALIARADALSGEAHGPPPGTRAPAEPEIAGVGAVTEA